MLCSRSIEVSLLGMGLFAGLVDVLVLVVRMIGLGCIRCFVSFFNLLSILVLTIFLQGFLVTVTCSACF